MKTELAPDISATSPRKRLFGDLGPLDALVVGAFVVYLLILSYLRSRSTMFWSDEVMGWLVLHSPSPSAFLQRWWSGLDSSGIFYYIFAFAWQHVFGESELALRLFSTAGVIACFVLLWMTARRFVSVGIATIALPLIFSSNNVVLWQLANARTYGFFIAASALAGYAFVLAAPRRTLTRSLLLLTFFAHLMLVGSHILGILYSGALLAGLVAQDLFFRIRRPKLYLSVAAAWLLEILNWPNLKATSAVGKPSFWTERPPLPYLVRGFFDLSPHTESLMLGAIAVVLAAWLARRKLGAADSLLDPERSPMYFLIGSFYAVNVAMFVVSRITTSIFVDRYLLPMTLATALLLCELLVRCTAWISGNRILWRVVLAVCLIQVLLAGRKFMRMQWEISQPNFTGKLLSYVPSNTPVLCTSVGIFAEFIYYQHAHAEVYTYIDWPVQLEEAKTGGGVSGMHEMENWKADGVYSDHIMPTKEFLDRFRDFDVLTMPGDHLWLDWRVGNNPHYKVTLTKTFDAGLYHFELWKVHAT